MGLHGIEDGRIKDNAEGMAWFGWKECFQWLVVWGEKTAMKMEMRVEMGSIREIVSIWTDLYFTLFFVYRLGIAGLTFRHVLLRSADGTYPPLLFAMAILFSLLDVLLYYWKQHERGRREMFGICAEFCISESWGSIVSAVLGSIRVQCLARLCCEL